MPKITLNMNNSDENTHMHTSPTGPTSNYGTISIIHEDEEIYFSITPLDEVMTMKKDAETAASSGVYSIASSIETGEGDSLIASRPQHTLEDHFFRLLGFSKNPFLASCGMRNSSASDMRLAMLSNFSTAYNVVSISLAIKMMSHVYPVNSIDESICSSALIAGMIIGQVVGGAIGDVLGRHLAMAVVMSLQVIGSLMSALSFNMPFNIYTCLAVWRFILGLGCGGVYPLAATMTAETSSTKEDTAKAVALTFSLQGLGYLAAPVLGLFLVSTFQDVSDLAWRLLLGFGCVPGVVLMVMRLRRQRSYTKSLIESSDIEMTDDNDGNHHEKIIIENTREVPVSVIDAIKLENDLVKKLLGTGGCWFLFDILFYGNTLFQPIVLSAAFGSAETLQRAAIDTSIIASMALPGYFVSVFMVGRQSPRFIQAQGLLMMGLLYTCIGTCFVQLADYKFLLMFTYGSTFFFSNYGPNTTTFMLPSLTFSKTCRSTLNGVCAACGKAGALLGTMIFAAAAARFGQQAVMLACGMISFVGMALTLWCIKETVSINETKSEQHLAETLLQKIPMKVVTSSPSLVDYFNTT